MENYIVRQPIFNLKKEVIAYEVLYQQDESSLFSEENDVPVANVIEDFLTQFDNDQFTGGKTTYLTFTPNLLLRNVPNIFSPDKLVIQVEDNSIVHPLAQKVIFKYKSEGYSIALKGFEFSPRYFAILDIIDIIKIDFAIEDKSSYENLIGICAKFNKKIIAYNVNTQDDYDLAEKMGCKQMQGNFLADLKTQKIHRVDHLQGNFFQLIVAVSKDDPDIDEIATIISRDVTLAFSLIKLVNSAYFALRNRAKSVKQALIVLGLGQLKQWVYLLSFKQDNSDTPDELIRISFLRANFAQEMVPYISNIPISKSEAYLMGMFSTLGVLMQVSLESALAELSVADEIKDALVKHEGLCGQLYDMILCYEKADWTGITKYAKELNIPVNIISQKYFECVEYVNKIWQTLTHPYDDAAD
ncbi:MAG: HDOD domain-containing protein [Oscillospiraceae bacterium]